MATIQTHKLEFLRGSQILLNKIPKYPLFEGDFIENIDLTLCNMIIESVENIPKENIDGFKTAVIDNLKPNGDLIVKHNQRHKLGRFYPDDNRSLIPHPRAIKHTIFKYAGWEDLDMIKGHATIALEVFKDIIDLPTIQEFVDNFDGIVDTLSKYYKTNTISLDADNIKWLFNMMIYGGTPDGWIFKLAEGGKGYDKKVIVDFKGHHPFVLRFEKECIRMSDKVKRKILLSPISFRLLKIISCIWSMNY
jgi:hypothetical protein